jgi:uncharacterized protein
MHIGIVSDTHNRYRTVEKALGLLRQRGVTTVLHCGDIEDAAVVEQFRGLDAHFVFGNCDTERAELREAMTAAGVRLHEPFGHLEVDGKNIAFLHGDDGRLLRDLITGGAYDYLFHGHTHQRRDERIGPTRVVNVGALHRARPKTFGVLDPGSGELEIVPIEEA